LTDPGITENYRRKVEQSKDKETYYSNLFAKGYEDFIAHSNADVDNDRCKDLRYDLRHYWEANVHDYSTVAPTLLSLSYYPLQIVAREWVNYMAVMSHSVKEYEPKSEPMQDPDTGMDLKELQRWRRRALSSQQKIGAGLRFIRDNTSGEPPASQAQWSACLEDWEYNSQGLKACSALLENMAQVAQIVDGRRSAEETRNTTRLTTLALIFFPLSLFASIFSMTDSFSPGKRLFGVYFAVAIPVCVILYFMVRPPKGVEEWLEKRSKTRRQIKTRKKREAKKDKAATEGEKAQQSEKARKAKTPPTSAPNAALENTHFNVV
jgi:Mg2+ and Co2+ transporter CorA